MPKKVDAEARRAELARALWAVLAREGIQGASIRAVAAEAEWSRGVVEHYFESKEQMIRYACRRAVEQTLRRVARTHRSLVGRDALRKILLNDLTLRNEPCEAAAVWSGLLSTASHDPELAKEIIRFDRALRIIIAEVIGEMISRGEVSADTDVNAKTRLLIALLMAMVLNLSLQPDRYTRTSLALEVDAFLDGLQVVSLPRSV